MTLLSALATATEAAASVAAAIATCPAVRATVNRVADKGLQMRAPMNAEVGKLSTLILTITTGNFPATTTFVKKGKIRYFQTASPWKNPEDSHCRNPTRHHSETEKSNKEPQNVGLICPVLTRRLRLCAERSNQSVEKKVDGERKKKQRGHRVASV